MKLSTKPSISLTIFLTLLANRLKPMRDGMATKSPATVVRSAPDIPGAIAAMFAEPFQAMPAKDPITPQTVPSRPKKGLAATTVDISPILSSNTAISSATVLSKAFLTDSDSTDEIALANAFVQRESKEWNYPLALKSEAEHNHFHELELLGIFDQSD